jgi:hypothetical protein
VTTPGLVIKPMIEPEFSRDIKLITVRGRPHSPAVGAFVRQARSYRWPGLLRSPAATAALAMAEDADTEAPASSVTAAGGAC